MLYIGGPLQLSIMGLFSNLFVAELALLPETWLRAISYVQEDAKVSIDRCTFYSGYEKDLEEQVQILLLILGKYHEIQKASRFSPHKLYSIKFPRRHLSQVRMLSLQPLSEEELRQVVAGPGARERMGL